jgi:hypothetical protein
MAQRRKPTMAAVKSPEVMQVEDVEFSIDDGLDNPWQSVLYHCDCHTYQQIIQQLMLAIGCTREQGYELAWRVNHHGHAPVYYGAQKDCEQVVRVLRDINLRAEVEPT